MYNNFWWLCFLCCLKTNPLSDSVTNHWAVSPEWPFISVNISWAQMNAAKSLSTMKHDHSQHSTALYNCDSNHISQISHSYNNTDQSDYFPVVQSDTQFTNINSSSAWLLVGHHITLHGNSGTIAWIICPNSLCGMNSWELSLLIIIIIINIFVKRRTELQRRCEWVNKAMLKQWLKRWVFKRSRVRCYYH